jgi:hypothetical protein
MSSQEDVDNNASKYILYYCGFINEDKNVYQTDCSDVCVIGYDEIDIHLLISGWIPSGYGAPSNTTLTSYDMVDVVTWFRDFYLRPQQISDAQHFKMSSTDLASTRTDSSMVGYIILNTTTQKCQYLNSSLVWTDCWA